MRDSRIYWHICLAVGALTQSIRSVNLEKTSKLELREMLNPLSLIQTRTLMMKKIKGNLGTGAINLRWLALIPAKSDLILIFNKQNGEVI